MVSLDIEFCSSADKYRAKAEELEFVLWGNFAEQGIDICDIFKNRGPGKGFVPFHSQPSWYVGRRDSGEMKVKYPRDQAFEVILRCLPQSKFQGLPEAVVVWSKLRTHLWPKVKLLAKNIAKLVARASRGEDTAGVLRDIEQAMLQATEEQRRRARPTSAASRPLPRSVEKPSQAPDPASGNASDPTSGQAPDPTKQRPMRPVRPSSASAFGHPRPKGFDIPYTRLKSMGMTESNTKSLPPWIQPSAVKEECSFRMPKTETRGITLKQLTKLADWVRNVVEARQIEDKFRKSETFGKRITWKKINLYHICDMWVKPLTSTAKCSYVEVVANGKQHPMWMVSHAWSTPFACTARMLSHHAETRVMSTGQEPADMRYWICTFANNQHDLAELESDLVESPFASVILRGKECVGTVILCDEKVTPMLRAWCVFELSLSEKMRNGFFTKKDEGAKEKEAGPTSKEVGPTVKTEGPKQPDVLHKEKYFLDVAATAKAPKKVANEGITVSLLQDIEAGDFREVCEKPGFQFPLEVAQYGTSVDVSKAEATEKKDKYSILNYIASHKASAEAAPPATHKQYDKLNNLVHSIFGSCELYRLLTEKPLGYTKAIEEMLKTGTNVNGKVRDGMTPLHAALTAANPLDADKPIATSEREKEEMLKMTKALLDARADPSIQDETGHSALDLSVERGLDELTSQLCKDVDPQFKVCTWDVKSLICVDRDNSTGEEEDDPNNPEGERETDPNNPEGDRRARARRRGRPPEFRQDLDHGLRHLKFKYVSGIAKAKTMAPIHSARWERFQINVRNHGEELWFGLAQGTDPDCRIEAGCVFYSSFIQRQRKRPEDTQLIAGYVVEAGEVQKEKPIYTSRTYFASWIGDSEQRDTKVEEHRRLLTDWLPGQEQLGGYSILKRGMENGDNYESGELYVLQECGLFCIKFYNMDPIFATIPRDARQAHLHLSAHVKSIKDGIEIVYNPDPDRDQQLQEHSHRNAALRPQYAKAMTSWNISSTLRVMGRQLKFDGHKGRHGLCMETVQPPVAKEEPPLEGEEPEFVNIFAEAPMNPFVCEYVELTQEESEDGLGLACGLAADPSQTYVPKQQLSGWFHQSPPEEGPQVVGILVDQSAGRAAWFVDEPMKAPDNPDEMRVQEVRIPPRGALYLMVHVASHVDRLEMRYVPPRQWPPSVLSMALSWGHQPPGDEFGDPRASYDQNRKRWSPVFSPGSTEPARRSIRLTPPQRLNLQQELEDLFTKAFRNDHPVSIQTALEWLEQNGVSSLFALKDIVLKNAFLKFLGKRGRGEVIKYINALGVVPQPKAIKETASYLPPQLRKQEDDGPPRSHHLLQAEGESEPRPEGLGAAEELSSQVEPQLEEGEPPRSEPFPEAGMSPERRLEGSDADERLSQQEEVEAPLGLHPLFEAPGTPERRSQRSDPDEESSPKDLD